MEKLICTRCSKVFERRKRTSDKKTLSGNVFCSTSCSNKFNKNHPPIGKKRPDMAEEKHFAWKGDSVGRTALHDWVKARLGRPKKCEHCGTAMAKKYEWANKSHKYKRELSDWVRFCTRCHREYDGHQEKMWTTRHENGEGKNVDEKIREYKRQWYIKKKQTLLFHYL